MIKDEPWLMESFIPVVQQRGAAIIKARGASSAASPEELASTTTMTASGLANGVLGNDTATTNGPMNAVLTGGVIGSTTITPQSLSVSTATETGNVVTITTTSAGTFVPGRGGDGSRGGQRL